MTKNARPLCAATTQKGNPCKNYATPDSPFCHIHEPPDADFPPLEEPSADDLHAQLLLELEELIARIKTMSPDYTPPPFSTHSARKLAGKALRKLSKHRPPLWSKVQSVLGEDLLDIDTWKGVWYMLNYTVEYQRDFLKRRVTGDYETDDWGMDDEFAQNIQPLFDFLYKFYWRVNLTGVENIPADGGVLLVGSASGQLPWLGAMVSTGVAQLHEDMRQVRSLYKSRFSSLPFFSLIFDKMGQVPANIDTAEQLLALDEVVAIYPESGSEKGITWLDLADLAAKLNIPIVPMAIIGVEGSETVSNLKARDAALSEKLAPWISILGQMPIPAGWTIHIGEVIQPTINMGAEDALAQLMSLANTVQSAIGALRKA